MQSTLDQQVVQALKIRKANLLDQVDEIDQVLAEYEPVRRELRRTRQASHGTRTRSGSAGPRDRVYKALTRKWITVPEAARRTGLSAYITKGHLTNLVTARLAETSQRGRVMYYRRSIYTD